jgi:lysophospholipase L1-like esterase
MILGQGLLVFAAVAMASWHEMPWLGAVAVVLLSGSAVAVRIAPGRRVWRWLLFAGWLCTVLVPASVWLTARGGLGSDNFFDRHYAIEAWVISLALLTASFGEVDSGFRARWKGVVITWAAVGGAVWIAVAYLDNRAGDFYAGLAVNTGLLALCQIWSRLPVAVSQAMTAVILMLVGLPVVDLFYRSDGGLRAEPDARRRHYSYESAKRDSVAFTRWWNYYLGQWALTEKAIYMPDKSGVLPWRLRPNSQSVFFQSAISINSRGFRGREIAQEKGNTYRIVALGESTTFGITLDREDRPWPEVLGELIRERLRPGRPLEVVNGGVPGYGVEQSVRRLASDILPLKPNMIICYHGINGFPLLYPALRGLVGPPPPPYEARPLRLLADCEYRLKLMAYKHRLRPQETAPPAAGDPMMTGYAKAYRQLIQICRTNGIQLVLANYSMAVNEQSEREAVVFYQAGYPAAPIYIKANAAHSVLVKRLAEECPEVWLADTHAHLDGEPGKFIDLVHFASGGERQMAENVFASIRPLLEKELRD